MGRKKSAGKDEGGRMKDEGTAQEPPVAVASEDQQDPSIVKPEVVRFVQEGAVGRIRKSTKIQRRRRERGEIARPTTAIRNFCLECTGYDRAEVARCTAPACWLFPYRMGPGVPPADAIRQELSLQQGTSALCASPAGQLEVKHG